MAKKGGTTDINGFVNVTNDVPVKTKPKLPSRKLTTTTTSKKSLKEDEDNKLKTTLKKDKLDKKYNGRPVTKVNEPTPKVSSKTNVLQETSEKNKDKLPKERQTSIAKETDRKQTNNIRTKEKKTANKVVNHDVTSNPSTSSPLQKKVPNQKNKKTEIVPKVDLKPQRVRSDSVIYGKETKRRLEENKIEVKKINQRTSKPSDISKTSNVKTKISVSSKSDTAISNTSKSKTSLLKISNNSKEKEKNHKQKEKVKKETQEKINNPLESDIIVNEETTIKSNYKDLIYFEVDVGNAKRSSGSRAPSARIKSAASVIVPMSRQGTFTKDDTSESLEISKLDEVQASENKARSTTQEDTDDVDYEDDFEEYESDFEEYVSEPESGLSSKSDTESEPVFIRPSTSKENSKLKNKSGTKIVEEERKLDSGNYDLSSKPILPQYVKQKQLDLIKEAIFQENDTFFDKKNEEVVVIEEYKPFLALDFVNALERFENDERVKKNKQRSATILEMIDLHEQDFDLFEETFDDLNIFEDLYQNQNVSHALTQTDLIYKDEEAQTDEIVLNTKWTQCPTSFHSWSSSSFDFNTFLEDKRGYGGDNVKIDSEISNSNYDTKSFLNFMNYASKVVLITLEEESRWRSDTESLQVTDSDYKLDFSDGCIPIQMDNVNFLMDRPICDILFSPHDSNIFMSSHRFRQDIEKLPSFTDQFLGRSVLCVWSVLEPSQPLYLLVASCQICAISFDSEYDFFIYAGLTDGSLCLWDLNELSIHHKGTTAGLMDYLLRTPTFCTSYLVGNDSHHNVIVSIQSLGFENRGSSSQRFNPTQILTLDTDGKVVMWIVSYTQSCLEQNEKDIEKLDPGMSFWGNFKLIPGKIIQPKNILSSDGDKWGLQFLSMSLAPELKKADGHNMKSVLVGTNIGKVLHFYVSEEETDVPVFSAEKDEKYTYSVMCIEKNPHGYPVFVTGCNDGMIRLYVMNKAQPFRVISSNEDFMYTPIIKINWSALRVGLLFALDKNFILHFWDVCRTDPMPQLSVSLKTLQAAHFDIMCDKKFQYIALSVQRFKIDIHRIKENLVNADFEKEKIIFERLLEVSFNLML